MGKELFILPNWTGHGIHNYTRNQWVPTYSTQNFLSYARSIFLILSWFILHILPNSINAQFSQSLPFNYDFLSLKVVSTVLKKWRILHNVEAFRHGKWFNEKGSLMITATYLVSLWRLLNLVFIYVICNLIPCQLWLLFTL